MWGKHSLKSGLKYLQYDGVVKGVTSHYGHQVALHTNISARRSFQPSTYVRKVSGDSFYAYLGDISKMFWVQLHFNRMALMGIALVMYIYV